MRVCAAISAGPVSSWRPAVLINSRPPPKLNKRQHSQIGARRVIDQLVVAPYFYCQMTTCCILCVCDVWMSSCSGLYHAQMNAEFICICKRKKKKLWQITSTSWYQHNQHKIYYVCETLRHHLSKTIVSVCVRSLIKAKINQNFTGHAHACST